MVIVLSSLEPSRAHLYTRSSTVCPPAAIAVLSIRECFLFVLCYPVGLSYASPFHSAYRPRFLRSCGQELEGRSDTMRFCLHQGRWLFHECSFSAAVVRHIDV